MSDATNWLPGVLVVAVGGGGALAFLLGARRSRGDAPAPENLEDLAARYESVLGQLRDHQAHRHHVPAETWETERARLEGVAAGLLRQRAELAHEREKAAARAERRSLEAASARGPFARRPWLAWALGALGVAVLAALSGYTLSSNTRDRTDGMGMTGIDPSSGGAQAAGGSGAPPVDPRLAGLFRLVQSAPRDVEAVNSLAAHLLRLQAFDEARPWIYRALAEDTFSVRARVNLAVLRALDGDDSGALAELERLSALYPEAYDARLFAGLLAMDLGDRARATRAFEAYLVQAPRSEQPSELRSAIDALLAGGEPAGSAASRP